MSTTFTQKGKFRHSHKFCALVVIGLCLLLAGSYTNNAYLDWGAAGMFVISMWYGILSLLGVLEKLSTKIGSR
jgi:hypothetical protein